MMQEAEGSLVHELRRPRTKDPCKPQCSPVRKASSPQDGARRPWQPGDFRLGQYCASGLPRSDLPKQEFCREVQWPYLGPPGASTKGRWKPPAGMQITANGRISVLLHASYSQSGNGLGALKKQNPDRLCVALGSTKQKASFLLLSFHGFLRPRG